MLQIIRKHEQFNKLEKLATCILVWVSLSTLYLTHEKRLHACKWCVEAVSAQSLSEAELPLPYRITHIIRLHPYSFTCKQNPGVLITELTYWQLLMTIRTHKQQGHVPGAGGMCYREFKVMWKEILENLHKQPFVMQTSDLKRLNWIGSGLLLLLLLLLFKSLCIFL